VRPRNFHPIGLAILCLTGAIGSSPTLGVIVKGNGPEGDGTNTAPFNDPANSYYGTYGGMTVDYVYRYGTATGDTKLNGSMDAIGYFSLITARHFGAGCGNKFTINEDQFQVTAVQSPPPDTVGGYTPDLEILTVKNLTHPNRPLPGFYQVRQTAPTYIQKAVIVGAGYAGTITGSGPYVPKEVNTTAQIVRWGTNQYYDTPPPVVLNTPILASTKVFRMLFDELPDSGLRISTDSYYGTGDSGGGVFYKNSTTSKWELGGINLYVDGESPYSTYAASLSSYKTWINTSLGIQKLPGDADSDQDVDVGDYLMLKENYGKTTGMTWAQGDFSGPQGVPDGAVNRYDLAVLEMNWGYQSPLYVGEISPLGLGGLVPEPATLALLAAGAAGLLLRRSSRGRRR
jgi:hypothetical protein